MPKGTPSTTVSTRSATADQRTDGLSSIDTLLIETEGLRFHADASAVPDISEEQFKDLVQDVRERGIDAADALHVLADKQTVIYGFQRLRAAKQARLRTVPCVVIDEPDPKGYMLRRARLEPQYTEGQRAILAYEYQQHMSKQLKSERAAKAGTARHSSLSDAVTDKQKPAKRDARQEAAAATGMSERVLRKVKKIHDFAEKPLRESLLNGIRSGKIPLNSAIRTISERIRSVEAQSSAAERAKLLAAMPPLDDWLVGDAANVLKGKLPEGAKISLLMIDFGDLDDDRIHRLLNVVSPSLVEQSAIVAVVPFVGEQILGPVLKGHGFRVERPLVWDVTDGLQSEPLGRRHYGILHATRAIPDQAARRTAAPLPSDILGSPLVDGHMPIGLYRTLVELFSSKGELVVLPNVAHAGGFIAARLASRSVVAVAINNDVHEEGRIQINRALAMQSKEEARGSSGVTEGGNGGAA